MGKLIAAVALLSLAMVLSIAALFILFPHTEPSDNASSGPAAGARLDLGGDTFDLGNVPGDRTVERTVSFTNTGAEPLEVEVVKVRPAPDASCGCGVEGYEVRPNTVSAGGTGQLVFQLRVPGSMADMEDIMIAELRTNDSTNLNPKIRLVFRMAAEEKARDDG